jgi:hypothetical protein
VGSSALFTLLVPMDNVLLPSLHGKAATAALSGAGLLPPMCVLVAVKAGHPLGPTHQQQLPDTKSFHLHPQPSHEPRLQAQNLVSLAEAASKDQGGHTVNKAAPDRGASRALMHKRGAAQGARNACMTMRHQSPHRHARV